MRFILKSQLSFCSLNSCITLVKYHLKLEIIWKPFEMVCKVNIKMEIYGGTTTKKKDTGCKTENTHIQNHRNVNENK